MSERRYHDYGNFLKAESQNSAQLQYIEAGVLNGNGLSASADGSQLEIGAGAVITEDGVIIVNNDTRTLSFTPKADATIWTVVQQHTFELEQGGHGSTYETKEFIDGATPYPEVVSSGEIVLGWIRYPGGSVDLDNYMIFEAPKLQILNVSVEIARADYRINAIRPLVFTAAIINAPGLLVEPEDTNVLASYAVDGVTGHIETTFVNNHAGLNKTVTLYAEPNRGVGLYRPTKIMIDVDTDNVLTLIEVAFNLDGTYTVEDTLTGSLLVGEQSILIDDQTIEQAPIESGLHWGIRVIVTLPPLATIVIRRLEVDASPVPQIS